MFIYQVRIEVAPADIELWRVIWNDVIGFEQDLGDPQNPNDDDPQRFIPKTIIRQAVRVAALSTFQAQPGSSSFDHYQLLMAPQQNLAALQTKLQTHLDPLSHLTGVVVGITHQRYYHNGTGDLKCEVHRGSNTLHIRLPTIASPITVKSGDENLQNNNPQKDYEGGYIIRFQG
ncbi:MAG: hypothetical protein MUF87_13950 [Anaerolineae bacterium]|jgi:hypothetical protein|nr:hypothetical protein [Anaerolineae bacterium]